MVRRLLRSDWSADMGAIFGQAVMIDYIAARQLFQLQVYYALWSQTKFASLKMVESQSVVYIARFDVLDIDILVIDVEDLDVEDEVEDEDLGDEVLAVENEVIDVEDVEACDVNDALALYHFQWSKLCVTS